MATMLNHMPTTMSDRKLGEGLKAICARAKLTTRAIAPHLGVNQSQVSRWFTGTRKIDRDELIAILGLAKATPAETAHLLRLLSGPTDLGITFDDTTWIALKATDRAHQIAALMEAEDNAGLITHFAALLVPGILQTGDYARAIYLGDGVEPAEARRRVAERIGRREILERDSNPVALEVFIHEGVLRSVVGDVEVMRGQLRYLIKVSKLDNVTLRVVDYAAGYTPLHSGQCSVIESPDAGPVVHQDFRGVGLFVEEPAIVERTMTARERLREIALSPEESANFLADLLENGE